MSPTMRTIGSHYSSLRMVLLLPACLAFIGGEDKACRADNTRDATFAPSPDWWPLNSRGMPEYATSLPEGPNRLKVRNPAHFKAIVQVRSGKRARQFSLESQTVRELWLPDGEYTIYWRFPYDRTFHYSEVLSASRGAIANGPNNTAEKADPATVELGTGSGKESRRSGTRNR